MGMAITLKATVSELKIASAGATPTAGKPDARIRRDGSERYFEVKFRGGSTQRGFPLNKNNFHAQKKNPRQICRGL
jgi:hypothetical protein